MSSEMEHPPASTDAAQAPDGPVAVVAAGAGARGAYEAGALSVIIPWLHDQRRPPTLFVGTSAGAINATLFAAVAHLEPHKGAKQVLDTWRELTMRRVFRRPYVSLWVRTLPEYFGQVLGRRDTHVRSLLDTRPLADTAHEIFAAHRRALHENIHGSDHVVEAVAVAATDDRERTTIFLEQREGRPVPQPDPSRGTRWVPVALSYEHLLASSAMPVLFPAVRVGDHSYVDGGVRLNAPLHPAIDLGADHLAVVATHPAVYPPEDGRPTPDGSGSPDVIDEVVAILGSVLADRMVEDLHMLGVVNEALAGRRHGRRRPIDYVFVGPESRHQLGALADSAYQHHHEEIAERHELEVAMMRFLIGRREEGAGDLLSYVFFDPAFAEDAIALGIEHAQAAIARANPWQTGPPALAAASSPATTAR